MSTSNNLDHTVQNELAAHQCVGMLKCLKLYNAVVSRNQNCTCFNRKQNVRLCRKFTLYFYILSGQGIFGCVVLVSNALLCFLNPCRQGQTQAFIVDDPSSRSNAGWIKRRERRQFATQTSMPRDMDGKDVR